MRNRILTLLLILAAGMSAELPAKPNRSYYGTNYTVPFAHAYRALDRLGIDHKKAIDRDVYHMSRLGLNAFRLHLWDVELTDSTGNLIANEHLDLLDYLIARLKERDIAITLTAQTNFGNGYPERNTDPYGAFSYRYEKCRVHDDAGAQKAQQRYIRQLIAHRNPYTGLTIADDPDIIAIEINNEPCHSSTCKEITSYINSMVKAMRSEGWKKDILYNVSHNMGSTQAFYDARIQGTTYQWYPTGLVAGHERKGNFLPTLDSYDIPFDTLQHYARMSRIIYEYDPADVLYTYLYPAAARTFRKAGFEWITQFAYDPIDMAWANTEYQTHFLNLAYTPGKAIGMMIAAEATRQIPAGTDFGKYPTDTIFADFLVSARRNLAMLNDGTHYYHTNRTAVGPKQSSLLQAIAGTGSSPLVTTDGTGAYFIDRITPHVWRLEVMPDVVLTADPFAKPSPSRRVGEIIYAPITMRLNLPSLSDRFHYIGITDDGICRRAADGTATLQPGVYLLSDDIEALKAIDPDGTYADGTRHINEYVAPQRRDVPLTLLHTPALRVAPDSEVTLSATVISSAPVDSVVVYPGHISFWNEHNRLYTMHRTGEKYEYKVNINTAEFKDCDLGYNIVVHQGGRAVTYPEGIPGTPLDWDYAGQAMYHTAIGAASEPIVLLSAAPAAGGNTDAGELSSIPEVWHGISYGLMPHAPVAFDMMRLHKDSDTDTRMLVISKHVADLIACYPDLDPTRKIKLRIGTCSGTDRIKLGLINGDGFTYSIEAPVAPDSTITFDPSQARLDNTLITPAPYPIFLSREFVPDAATATPLRLDDLAAINIVVTAPDGELTLDIAGLWIE